MIRVNRSFLAAGAALLWETVVGIEPLLKLLPWHEDSEYRGLGKYPYVGGAADWGRFCLYSPLIRHIKIGTELDGVVLPHHFITELVYHPYRPLSFFPGLRSITIGEEDISASLPLLEFLANNSLQSLDISACSSHSNATHEDPVDERVRAFLPLINTCAPNLKTFRYKGPAERGLFHGLWLLKNITDLDLTWVDQIDGCDLLCLGALPQLRNLQLATAMPISILPLAALITPQGSQSWQALRVFKVTGVDILHCIISSLPCVHRYMEELHMVLTRVDKPAFVKRTLGHYLRSNPNLESVRVQIPMDEQPAAWPNHAEFSFPGQSDFDLEQYAKASFALPLAALKTVAFEGIPESLWRFMSSTLQNSIGGWRCLTSLTFRIQHPPTRSGGTPAADAPSNPDAVFPGPSFLANVIWLECPRLEFLDFPLNEAKVMTEDLSRITDNVKRSAQANVYPSGHPLRELVINTCTHGEEDSGQAFDPDRKVELVDFLEGLFPSLKSGGLRGTPTALWGDMGAWLHTYRKLKDKAAKGK
ncbi:hypothetical protein NMY22_g3578 [Coprinellus aureogranulatus]|nr:hypothetical protein NMY22_g3578 [Coprinellus aureogranulatus]